MNILVKNLLQFYEEFTSSSIVLLKRHPGVFRAASAAYYLPVQEESVRVDFFTSSPGKYGKCLLGLVIRCRIQNVTKLR